MVREKNSFSFYSWVQKRKRNFLVVVIGLVLIFISAIINISTGVPIITNYLSNTFFYKDTMQQRIESLIAGEQISIYEDLIGKPRFINNFDKDKLEYVFLNKYFYVDAITDKNGNVLQYAVTTRRADFNPVFESPVYEASGTKYHVALGETKFNDLPAVPIQVVGCDGANYFYYYETHSIGNPTNYQSYAFGDNLVGYMVNLGSYNNNFQYLEKITQTNCPGVKNITVEDTKKNLTSNAIVNWRSNNVINTFLVTAPNQEVMDSGAGIGVLYTQVRVAR